MTLILLLAVAWLVGYAAGRAAGRRIIRNRQEEPLNWTT